MRIIGGEFKGKRIKVLKSFKGRPTTDFAKEALFNILDNSIDYGSTKALDLFAGTGAISFELVSRAVKSLQSVEINYKYGKFIDSVFEELGADQAEVLQMDVFSLLQHSDEKFDLIFADPPFDNKRILEIPALVLDNGLLSEEGQLIVEHSPHTDMSSITGFVRKRKYGHVCFSFFKVTGDQ
jgi:16S rRNA (guanine(966)-N(2))-methyltransferase RsmD